MLKVRTFMTMNINDSKHLLTESWCNRIDLLIYCLSSTVFNYYEPHIPNNSQYLVLYIICLLNAFRNFNLTDIDAN